MKESNDLARSRRQIAALRWAVGVLLGFAIFAAGHFVGSNRVMSHEGTRGHREMLVWQGATDKRLDGIEEKIEELISRPSPAEP